MKRYGKFAKNFSVVNVLRQSLASCGIAAVAVMQVMPSYAQVVEMPGVGTNVTTTGAITNVTTSRLLGSAGDQTAVAGYTRFDIANDHTVNVHQPGAAARMINIINGPRSEIAGTLNAGILTTDAGVAGGMRVTGGDVYFLNTNGFLVSSTGVINAGRLTMTTPTSEFTEDLMNETGLTAGLPPIPGNSPLARLIAGSEPLNDSGSITLHGTINAERFEARAGLIKLMEGTITVKDDGASGPLAPAVNTKGVPTAGAVVVEGGVVRLLGKKQIEMRRQASIKASRGTAGGLIEVIHGDVSPLAANDLTESMKVAASFDVSGSGTGKAGSVLLFTKGSAVLEAPIQVDATSAASDGGLFYAHADDKLTAQGGAFALAGDTGQIDGQVYLTGKNVEITGGLTTGGGSLGVKAEKAVTIGAADGSDIELNTGGADGNYGDIVLYGTSIALTQGAKLVAADRTRAAGDTGKDGFVGLFARSQNEGIAWAIQHDVETAKITITDAQIDSGALAITAVSKVSNLLEEADPATEAQALADAPQGEGFEDAIGELVENTITVIEDAIEGGLNTINSMIPLQGQRLTANAKVTIINSDLFASGNVNAPTAEPVDPGATPVPMANNGFLKSGGLVTSAYKFLQDGFVVFNVDLPTKWDPANESMFIHSHAQTTAAIAPKSYALGLGVLISEVDSQVLIDGGSLTTQTGGIRIASTATEKHSINFATAGISGLGNTIAIATRFLSNKALVQTTINSGGAVSLDALTGKAHSAAILSNAGTDGKEAIALNGSYSDSITQAILSGNITAAGDVDVLAETLYFQKSSSTNATMGLTNLQKYLLNQYSPLHKKMNALTDSVKEKILGKSEEPTEPKKPGVGVGFALDVQIDLDKTFASVGDFVERKDDSGTTLNAPVATTITTPTGDFSVQALQRFASDDPDTGEGGSGLSRNVSAKMGVIGFVMQKQLDAVNAILASQGKPPVSEEDMLGEYGKAFMGAASISSMVGETRAKIAKDVTATVKSVKVNAETQYPHSEYYSDLVQSWVDENGDYYKPGPVEAELGPNGIPAITPPEPPRVVKILPHLNPLTQFTTQTGASGKAQGAKDADGNPLADREVQNVNRHAKLTHLGG